MKRKIIGWGIAAVLLFFSAFTGYSLAYADEAEASAPPPAYSLRVEYKNGDAPIEGAVFRLYRVTGPLEKQEYPPTEAFAGIEIDVGSDMSNSEWMAQIELLTAAIQERGIKADEEGVTDKDGVLAFENIQGGLYLIEGDELETDALIYRPQPLCIYLPQPVGEGVQVRTVAPTFEGIVPATPTPEPTPIPTPSNDQVPTGDGIKDWMELLVCALVASVGSMAVAAGHRHGRDTSD